MIDSDSDERTVNNVMRHQYRVLDSDEKTDMLAVKDTGLAFFELLDTFGKAYDQRCLALAKTKIEEAVMWATKAITK